MGSLNGTKASFWGLDLVLQTGWKQFFNENAHCYSFVVHSIFFMLALGPCTYCSNAADLADSPSI